MATTAKQSSTSPSNVRNFAEGQEDLETIAKQISDHAEAIYQTWKARGLAPTEILNCHTDDDTAFTQSLSPTAAPPSNTATSPSTPGKSTNKPGVAELLAQAPELSNNSLEQLVNSFVSEDKARIAAQKRGGSSGIRPLVNQSSSIKNVLQKFERPNEPINSPVNHVKPNYLRQNSNTSSNNNNNNNSTLNKNNVPDVLKDTIIEQKQVLPKEKPQTPVKPEHLLNHVPSWPLKNKVIVNNQVRIVHNNNNNNSNNTSNINNNLINNQENLNRPKHPIDLMDEVSREEERLINALKTGTVLNNTENLLPEVITSTLNDRDLTDFSRPDLNNISGGSSSNGDEMVVAPQNEVQNIKHWNGVPMKPNHIPIVNIHQHRDDKVSANFATRVATARMPKGEYRHVSADGKREDFKPTTAPSPIRPFLSRGSVAERVLIFEKCPEKGPLRKLKEPTMLTKLRVIPQSHSTLQRHLKSSAKNIYIPQFHFPHGKPQPAIITETTYQRLEQAFAQFPQQRVSRDRFHMIVSMCQVPLYWRVPLYTCTPLTPDGSVDGDIFLTFWRNMTSFCHDGAARFIHIISKGNRARQWITPEDIAPLIQDVVDTHPGLAFLKEAAEFHSRYVHTVIARIFYNVNRSWSGKITVPELRKSNLLDVIQLLEEEEDINQIMAYFSYEHFYVIYCKFWELDRDHDLYIDQQDLARHNDHALSSRMIERIFSGCVTRGGKNKQVVGPSGPKMSYTEFVWFLLAEEDKCHLTSVEYWFRCMDIDGDGVLSMYELEYFYEEQQQRMESLGIETLPFEDCLCQMLDMIKPSREGCITLADLKRCKMTPIFFDTFFNLEKYMEHEQRDPFAQKENDDLSDWDRYAAQEYELLVAEEGGDTQGSYDEEEDYESNIDILESQMDDCMLNEW